MSSTDGSHRQPGEAPARVNKLDSVSSDCPPGSESPSTEPHTTIEDATNTGLKFAKTFLMIFPIYVVGYFGFSFTWILISLAALFWLRRNENFKSSRAHKALQFFEHEERATRPGLSISELPPWVHFPDVERVEWLNKTIQQMWPYICQFVDKLFHETIEPAVQGANAHLGSFCFSKVDMGEKPLRVNGVKVYTESVDKRQIIMDLQISFVGNTEINVEIRKYYCRAGISSIQLHGVLRVIMEPLLGDMPLIGGLSMFFLQKPDLDINWTGLTNILDIPGLNGLCDGVIEDIICSNLMLPNKISVPLLDKKQLDSLRFPMPKAVLRVYFLEGQDLMAKDKFLGGLIKGKSDPYGVIKVGNKLVQSHVIKDNLNPKWNEVHEFFVSDQQGQLLEVELFDEDPDEDDSLGRIAVDLIELEKEQKVDEWFVLEEATTGKLHLKLEWLTPLSTPHKLDEVLNSNRAYKGQANDGPSSALLLVHLDSAKNLPVVFEGSLANGCLKERRSAGLVFCENTANLYRTVFFAKKVSSDPCPLVYFKVGHTTYNSKTRYKTTEPVWEEAFTFLIHNPKNQDLDVEVKDEKHECSLGTLHVPLSQLLEADEMTILQRFPLKSAGPNATLKMKIALRVLSLERLQSPNQSSGVTNVPDSSFAKKVSNSKSAPISPSSGATSRSHHPPVSEIFQSDPKRAPSVEVLSNATSFDDSPVHPVTGRSMSYLAISGSQMTLNNKEPTPSIASDLSHPYATQELHNRLKELRNGSISTHFPLGEIELTLRYSSQRKKLMVVVHKCRNLISFTESGSDPYVRIYLLPDKRRSGRRKTNTVKKNLNPVYDQTFEFSVSETDLHKRTLDVAVKNGGGILSKHKGLLGKVWLNLMPEDLTKGTTNWYELSEDGLRKSAG